MNKNPFDSLLSLARNYKVSNTLPEIGTLHKYLKDFKLKPLKFPDATLSLMNIIKPVTYSSNSALFSGLRKRLLKVKPISEIKVKSLNIPSVKSISNNLVSPSITATKPAKYRKLQRPYTRVSQGKFKLIIPKGFLHD
ncbi:MAG: hypothetical protein M1308_13785 [Actinobacteria bacterium]|nr:hypothetical protein [Actinomycetota bacterium]